MGDNETENTLPDTSGPAVRGLVEPDGAFADLPSIEIVFASADGDRDAAEETAPAHDTSSIYLIDHIDLADIIADLEVSELTDLTALLHQPLEELKPYPALDEQDGDSLAEAVIPDPETRSAPATNDAPDPAVVGLFSGNVTIIVDDGDGGYGSTV